MNLQYDSTGSGHLLRRADGVLMGECCCSGVPELRIRPHPPPRIVGDRIENANGFGFSLHCTASDGNYGNLHVSEWGTHEGELTWSWGYTYARIGYGLEVRGPNPYDPPEYQWPAYYRLTMTYELEAAPALVSGSMVVAEGQPTLHTDGSGIFYVWTAVVDVNGSLSVTYPLREFVTYNTVDDPHKYPWLDESLPAEYFGRHEAELGWIQWPDDLSDTAGNRGIVALTVGGHTVQARATSPGVGGSVRWPFWTAPLVVDTAAADMANGYNGDIYYDPVLTGKSGIVGDHEIASFYNWKLCDRYPTVTTETRAVAGLGWVNKPQLIEHWLLDNLEPVTMYLDSQLTFAPDYGTAITLSALDGRGGDLPGTLTAVGEGDGASITVTDGTGGDQWEEPCYRLVQNGVEVRDCIHLPEFRYHYDPDSLTAAYQMASQWRVPLRLPYSWAVYPACRFQIAASHVVDDCTDAAKWTPTGCGVAVSGGKLAVTVSGTGQSIARQWTGEQAYWGTSRYLRLKVSCDQAGGVATVTIGTKTWTITLSGTAEETSVLDLCAPSNLSGVDSSKHSRYEVEFSKTAGGWGYGADNAPSHYLAQEYGNQNSGWPLTLSIGFNQAGAWTIDELEFVPDGTGVCGVADMIADETDYQIGQADVNAAGVLLWGESGDIDIYGRRGLWAMQGRITVDEPAGLGYEHPTRGREAIPMWQGEVIDRNRARAFGRGLMWLESLSPWQAVLLPDSPHVPAGQRLDRTEQGEPTGDRYYAWPSQFCCDWLDMAYLEPCLKELEPGQGILGRLWADMVRLRPGVSGNLSSVRWFGGAFAGVVCDASTGAVASEVVTGTSGTDTVSGTTDGAGFYDIGGANDESYSVAHDSDTASLSGRVWRRASFPD